MPLNTAAAAIHITPTVIKTFLKHYSERAAKKRKGEVTRLATDSFLYDEAFHIVKAFIELATLNTVESLQAFTNTHVPATPWSIVCPVLVPMSSCNQAADTLIEWFGHEELTRVVGGERWWQVRGLEGVESEWVAETSTLEEVEESPQHRRHSGKNMTHLSENEANIVRLECLDRVMLYVHGGAYFWGSINTHRYQIVRYARKMKGRAFAVNYRKAPQYPWPCPLQDVLAAYFYLINPPQDAVHPAISPENIVFAGDSAGGGLCLTVLTILRDLGLPMPAGCVLISPWVDLTHSFPSVMENTTTDIIPPRGFINKPSQVWPIDIISESRIRDTQSRPPPQPGHADVLKPDEHRLSEGLRAESKAGGNTQAEMIEQPSDEPQKPDKSDKDDEHQDIPSKEDWQPKPPKVLMKDPKSTPLELCSQIQLYATNEQLSHPLVSPVLQGSLGNLCPLYILAGDGEALRDEIIYLAHRAADPQSYPHSPSNIEGARRQKENIEKFKNPTPVHLEVFDGMCHVLTVFTFTMSAKYAYRSISEFARKVTENRNAGESAGLHDFPGVASSSNSEDKSGGPLLSETFRNTPTRPQDYQTSSDKSEGTLLLQENKKITHTQVAEEQSNNQGSPKRDSSLGLKGFIIRQRVDIKGIVCPMEPPEEMTILRIPPTEIGLLKEAPARRWMEGQEEWDKKFKSRAKRIVKERKKNERKYNAILARSKELGLHRRGTFDHLSNSELHNDPDGREIRKDRRWGPLDLEHEDPPPSAIAGRRDTDEAIALLKKSLYHSAPATIISMPIPKAIDNIKAALDPNDDPFHPPIQSASEQQRKTDLMPIHGLRMWSGLMGYFARLSSKKVSESTTKAAKAMQDIGGRVLSDN